MGLPLSDVIFVSNMRKSLKKIRKFLQKLIDVLLPLVSAALLLGVNFGPDVPFIGQVYTNLSEILKLVGQDGLLALISIVIILAFLKKKK